MKVTTFVVTLPEGVMLEHLYEKFLAHDTLLHYHRALAKNDIVAYGPFEQASPSDVSEEEEESSSAASGASAAAEALLDPVLPFFKRKASVLMPLAAPRPLQLALGTSVIKLRLRQSVAVLRRAKVINDDDENNGDGNGDDAPSLAPLDVIEFRSAPRLWIPEAKDLPLGKISLVASYEEIVEEKKEGEGASAAMTATAVAAAPPLVDPGVTPFHLSPRRRRSRSVSLAGGEGPSSAPPVPLIRQRIRIDVAATADFQPEGWMATFKRPLESVMLAMVVKSARGIANEFAACAASDAGVGPLHPDLTKMPDLVKPRLPRELIYLETRRLSVDGPPGISRGLTVDEAEAMQESAAKGSERASAVAAAAAAAAGAVVAAEVAAENGREAAASGSKKAPVAAPAPPRAASPAAASLEEPVTPDREIGATYSLARVSLASSAGSFHSAASELERLSLSFSDDDGGENGGENDGGAAVVAKTTPALAQPATPARGEAPSSDGRFTVSLVSGGGGGGGGGSSSSSKRVLRMPRWLVPGNGAPPRRSRSSASLAEQANGPAAAASSSSFSSASAPDSSSSNARPRSAPGGSSNGREGEQAQTQLQQLQQPVRRPVLAWLRPKSARA